MSKVESFSYAAVLGAIIGMSIAAVGQGKLDDRAVASGYFIHKDRAYQLVPAPTPSKKD